MSIANWKEREKEQRGNDIIDAAEKLFFNRAYDGVSMDDIASEVGLGKGTLYLYFKDKESLYYAVALRGMRILNEMHVRCSNLDAGGIDKLRALTHGYHEFAREHPQYFLMLCHVASNPSSAKGNDYVKKFTELALGNIQITSRVLEEGMTEGKVRNDLDPTEMAIFLSIIGNSILKMDPVWEVTLQANGTGRDQIWSHYLRFISPAVVTSRDSLLVDDRNDGVDIEKPWPVHVDRTNRD